MSASYDVVVTSDEITPCLNRVSAGLKDRTRLNEMIGGQAQVLTRNHLIDLAASRHDSANRLGATPTGHLARAAESVAGTSDAEAAVVTVTSPGIARAFHALDIVPVNAKLLTIPASPLSYGKRASEVERQIGELRFAVLGGHPSLVAGKDDNLTVLFWLASSVHIPQDRTLLPSDEQYLYAAESASRFYLNALVQVEQSELN